MPCSGRWTRETSRADAGVQALPDFLALMHLMILQSEQFGNLLALVLKHQRASTGELKHCQSPVAAPPCELGPNTVTASGV